MSDPSHSRRSSPGNSAICRNCGAVLQGKFCHQCGQEAGEPPGTIGPVLLLAATHAIGVEGKAMRSLGSLLLRPGRLTRAFIDGHRVRYSHPAQLFLWCTAIFFLLHAYSPLVILDPASGAVESRLSVISLGSRLSDSTMARLATQATSDADFVQQFDTVVSLSLPVLLFGLVAAAALLMAAQFRRESALTHMVFAAHWSAFYFSLEALRHVVGTLGVWGARASLLGSLLALVYLAVAMQVVYRRGWLGSAVRALISIVLFAGLLATWLWATALLAERLA